MCIDIYIYVSNLGLGIEGLGFSVSWAVDAETCSSLPLLFSANVAADRPGSMDKAVVKGFHFKSLRVRVRC